MSMEPLICVRDVARRLGVSVCTVYRLKDRPGGIPAYRVGEKCIRFKPDEVDEYLSRQAVKPVRREEQLPGIRRFKYQPGMKVVSL